MSIINKPAMILFCIFGVTPGIVVAAPAAEPTQDQQMEMTRAEIKNQRKQIVAANMEITADQAQVFWPLYQQYTSAMQKVNDRELALIQGYANAYNTNTLTNGQAKSMFDEWMSIEQAGLELKKKFAPKFEEILPSKKVVRFFQIDNKLDAIINFELARVIPLVQ
ncbi:MAG: hypothetical protein V3W33_00265 [Gammaproteobacteria bacterium]|jgi:hypothetical protein